MKAEAVYLWIIVSVVNAVNKELSIFEAELFLTFQGKVWL